MATRSFLFGLFMWVPLACGPEASSSSSSSGGVAPCTPEAQGFKGATPLSLTSVDLLENGGVSPCDQAKLVKSQQELDQALMGVMNVPQELTGVDFMASRVVFHTSNPAVAWAIDDGASLVIGLESLCQGIAPHCTSVVIAGTTRDSVNEKLCPSEPCGPVP